MYLSASPLRFLIPLTLFAIFCFAAAFSFLIYAAKSAHFKRLESFPRAKLPGALMTALVLAALVPHIEQLLGPDSILVQYHLLWLLGAVFFLLILTYADFLCARALSVCCIFAAYTLLREGFAENPPLYPLLAICFFLTGLLGIVISAKPVWLRDWLRAASTRCSVRLISGIAFLLPGLLSAAVCILMLRK